MAWDFTTEPEFQKKLDWVASFVAEEVRPLKLILGSPYDVWDEKRNAIVRPLQEQVREKGLWACNLPPELGGQGVGQVQLALLNEVLGTARFGPVVFGCQAPDSGNAEVLAKYGTEAQKQEFLEPLLRNEIVSSFAMSEPQGGADPALFTMRGESRDGDWILNGEKWFVSNARYASFFLVLAVTDPDAPLGNRLSTFIVPSGTEGVEIVRNLEVPGDREGSHAWMRFTDVKVPADGLLGNVGGGFEVAQVRLNAGRLHHAMRTLGAAREILDQMCLRAVSRNMRNGRLADNPLTQEKIADSWIELEQFRLLVLRTAWLADTGVSEREVGAHVSAVKAATPKVLESIASRALHLHGALGVTTDMPFGDHVLWSHALGLADGPTEVHKVAFARRFLKNYEPLDSGPFPPWSRHDIIEAATARHAAVLGGDGDVGRV
jgi:acyl-CoA dehydrogenase